MLRSDSVSGDVPQSPDSAQSKDSDLDCTKPSGPAFDWSRMRLDSDRNLSPQADCRLIATSNLHSTPARQSAEALQALEAQQQLTAAAVAEYASAADGDVKPAPKRLSAELLRQVTAAAEQNLQPQQQHTRLKGRVSALASADATGSRAASLKSVSSGASLAELGPVRLDEALRPQLPDLAAGNSLEAQGGIVRQQLAAAFVSDTLNALPCRAQAVSHLR